jgi:hypothetical protein
VGIFLSVGGRWGLSGFVSGRFYKLYGAKGISGRRE